MKSRSRLIGILACSFFLTACDYRLFDPAVVTLDNAALEKVQSPDVILTEPNFQSIFETVIQPKCLSCHEPGGRAEDVPLATYEDLFTGGFEVLVVPGEPESSLFYQVMLPGARRPMPPPRSAIPPVELERLEAIRQWIEMGAPLLP